jgi:hypothetical protein
MDGLRVDTVAVRHDERHVVAATRDVAIDKQLTGDRLADRFPRDGDHVRVHCRVANVPAGVCLDDA